MLRNKELITVTQNEINLSKKLIALEKVLQEKDEQIKTLSGENESLRKISLEKPKSAKPSTPKTSTSQGANPPESPNKIQRPKAVAKAQTMNTQNRYKTLATLG
jgi:hypothetical protein